MILIYLKTLLLAHLIVKFEPLHILVDNIKPFCSRNLFTKLIYNMFVVAMTCFKCASLYTGFVIGGFWCGIVCSFIAYLWSNLVTPHIEKIRLL